MSPAPRRRNAILVLFLSGLALAGLSSCGGGDSQKAVEAKRAEIAIDRDVPDILRNTIGAEATLRGREPTLVSGYGVVVGLNGTGSRDIPIAIRALLEREMVRQGVGQGLGPLSEVSPSEFLDNPDTAVVLVRAVIQPGSPAGTRFDVLVEALPGTATTSLEGGRLYTTKLYRGLVRPVMPSVRPIGEARGEILINPFADPASDSTGSVLRTSGRVLNGGIVTEPWSLVLALDNASHTRARAVTDAINSRFPRGSNLKQTARGANDELIEITIPREFNERPEDFTQLLLHTRIDQNFPKEWALRYTRALKESPELADPLNWCLQALGETAVGFVRELYAYPEERPRLAAIQAGARLRDPAVRTHLEDLALNGAPAFRANAYRLLADLPPDPRINQFLRDRLDAPDIDTRIAAFEGLLARADPVISTVRVGGKFKLMTAPSTEAVVYVSQQREPRVVILGTDVAVNRPVFMSAWSDRLMLTAQSENDPVRVFYRDYRTDGITTQQLRPDLPGLIQFMAHKTTPEQPDPGLDFSYSEIVGALYEMTKSGAIAAAFVPESDRLGLEILRSAQVEVGSDRPEESPEGPIDALPDPAETQSESETPGDVVSGDRPEGDGSPASSTQQPTRRQYVVPLPPPAKKGDKPADKAPADKKKAER